MKNGRELSLILVFAFFGQLFFYFGGFLTDEKLMVNSKLNMMLTRLYLICCEPAY